MCGLKFIWCCARTSREWFNIGKLVVLLTVGERETTEVDGYGVSTPSSLTLSV